MKKEKEFPVKFWIILGVTVLASIFAISVATGYLGVGQLGVEFNF